MKTLFLSLIIVFLGIQVSWSQADYKHVTSDFAEGKNLTYFIKHKITLDGIWGLGGNVQYMLKHLIYAEADAGYGWVIADHSNDTEYDKKFRGWVDIKVGYPFINFIGKKTGKWVTGQSSTQDHYYRIDVPAHYSLIALVGFTSEPTPKYQAPVYKVGLKWISYLEANVKVRENTGFVQRKFEFYAGIVIPAKDEILWSDNTSSVSKTEGLSLEFMFSFPYRLNGWGTFDIGMRSLGYDDNGHIYIGNTFYL